MSNPESETLRNPSGIVYVGIDIGTSRSAVSTSTQERHQVESYVGWPTDLVARKLLKKRVFFGQEAIDKRAMLDLRRPLERGMLKVGSEKDEVAVHELLQHLLDLAKADAQYYEKVYVVVGAPAKALRADKQKLRQAMIGLADSLMVVSEPFAVAYAENALLHTMVIDIGAGTTDFCVMNGRYPTDEEQRTLETAGDAIDAYLATLIQEKYPAAKFSIHMVRAWKEAGSFIGNSGDPVIVTAPIDGKPTTLDITAQIRRACESLVPPLTETMLDLLARVDPEFQETVRRHIILSGGGSLIPGLKEALEQALAAVGGGVVRVLPNPIFSGADGALAIAQDAVDSDWEAFST